MGIWKECKNYSPKTNYGCRALIFHTYPRKHWCKWEHLWNTNIRELHEILSCIKLKAYLKIYLMLIVFILSAHFVTFYEKCLKLFESSSSTMAKIFTICKRSNQSLESCDLLGVISTYAYHFLKQAVRPIHIRGHVRHSPLDIRIKLPIRLSR